MPQLDFLLLIQEWLEKMGFIQQALEWVVKNQVIANFYG